MAARYPVKAVLLMEETLRFYRDSKWNLDYPGGIDGWPNHLDLDMGWRAKRTLANPIVKRAVKGAKAPSHKQEEKTHADTR